MNDAAAAVAVRGQGEPQSTAALSALPHKILLPPPPHPPRRYRSASLDMFLLRSSASILSSRRGGDLVGMVDAFGRSLFGELDYKQECRNGNRFREAYSGYAGVRVPKSLPALTTGRVLVSEWIEGEKGPWGDDKMRLVRIGIRCCVNQLLDTGYFHADPHRGNLLRAEDGSLAFIDFGNMADISAEERYGLIGLVLGLQNKDVELVTENLLGLGFLKDTTQLDELVPRLRQALKNATGGTGKAK